MPDSVNLKEFVSGFVLESDEHLHTINKNLVATSEALKLGRPEPRAIRELFRSIHTIKGLASMVGAEPIVEITHEMESILRTADRAGGRISERALDLTVQGVRALEERVHAVSKQGTEALAPAPAAFMKALIQIQKADAVAAPEETFEFSLPPEISRVLSAGDREQLVQASAKEQRAVLIEFRPSPENAAMGLNITSVRQRLSEIGELVKVVPRSSPEAPTGIAFSLLMVTPATLGEVVQASGCPENFVALVTVSLLPSPVSPAIEVLSEIPTENDWVPTDQSSIRVDIGRLDEALERLADLVISRSRLGKVEAELRERGADTRELKLVIADHARQLRRLRGAITAARMVPLAELLQRLPLVVRGLTNGTQKSVNVDIQAGSAEVDKAVADKIFPAIIHLVRNAVDHAIENRQDRKHAGKPETATLTVKCDDSFGTNLVLTVTDDGRGIDREAVALKLGLPVSKSNDELLQQISAPGLSTASTVTHVSGRGMGMDIAKRSVEILGGALTLSTEPGHGTSFSIRVPVSITIVDVMSFVSGDQTFVAPVSMIDEIIEVDSGKVYPSPNLTTQGASSSMIQRRGEAIPLMGLDSVLYPREAASPFRKALVVNHGRGSIAFGIERMLGQQEVVVRPLADALVKRPGLAGATDLGDGRPTLVLDLATLSSIVTQNGDFFA